MGADGFLRGKMVFITIVLTVLLTACRTARETEAIVNAPVHPRHKDRHQLPEPSGRSRPGPCRTR